LVAPPRGGQAAASNDAAGDGALAAVAVAERSLSSLTAR
jgi:hypothetical protein